MQGTCNDSSRNLERVAVFETHQDGEWRRLFDTNDSPAMIHFAEGKFPLQLAGTDQVVRETAQTLCLFEVFTENALDRKSTRLNSSH